MKTQKWWVWAVGALAVLVLLGAGIVLGRTTATQEPGGDGATAGAEPTATPDVDAPAEEPETPPDASAPPQYVRVYMARGEYLGVALRSVPATKGVATAAVQQLLAGPTAAESGWGFSSQIPAGTELLGLSIADGTARVDLSGDFASGGGTLSMTMRLAQVVYTLTQFPSVERVVLLMDGQVVDVFGGEGILLDEPQTRADYEYVMPALFVEGPAPGETITSPVRVWGTGNTFEAAFMVRLETADGAAIVEVPGMATSGTGTRGTFDLSLTFPDAAGGAGTLVVYESSAQDGSEINVIRIPVSINR